MSEQNQHSFRSRDEELEYVGRQIGDIKDALREILGRVNQIERHVKRAFGVSILPGQSSAKRATRATDSSEAPTLSPEQVRPIFDDLTRLWEEESPESVEERLQDMSLADLKVMAHELGLSFASKPSRKLLVSRIIGRVNESLMLSRNSNVTLSRREQQETEGDRKITED